MKTMSYNILCYGKDGHEREKREPMVLEIIRKNNPDTFGVQEATPEWMDFLKKSLTEYSYVGVGRDDGDNKGEYSAVFYKTDSFNVLDKGNFWLSETPEKPGKGWDAACVRICSWVLLENKENSKKFIHLNTHLDHKGSEARKLGALDVVRYLSEQHLPCIITGDMNAVPGTPEIDAFTAYEINGKPVIDATATLGGTFHGFGKYSPERAPKIDYIFTDLPCDTSKSYIVTDTPADGLYISDHNPVCAFVELA